MAGKSGGGSRKFGRNKVKCQQYKSRFNSIMKRRYKKVEKSCGEKFANNWLQTKQKQNLGI